MLRELIRSVFGLTAAHLAIKPVWFWFIAVLCTRLLGPAEYGVLTVTLSMAAIAVAPTDLGMARYTVREVARDRANAPLFFTNYLILRAALSLASGGLAIVAAIVLGYRGTVLAALVFACVYAFVLNLRAYASVMLEAFEALPTESYFLIAERVAIVGCGMIPLYLFRSTYWTLAGMAVGATVVTALHIKWISRHLASFRWSMFSISFLRKALRASAAIGVAGIFGLLYNRADAILVERMLGETAAGQYGVAYQLLLGLNIIPTVVITGAMAPRFARYWHHGDQPSFRYLLRWGIWGSLVLGVIVATIMMFSTETIIRIATADPAFEPAVGALQILGWTFPLTCLHLLLTALFVATDRLRYMPYIFGAAMFFNITVNFLVIPHYGINGAATVTVASEALIVLGYIVSYIISPKRFVYGYSTNSNELNQ